MRLSTFLTIAALLALVFGIGFILAPSAMLAQYGVTTDAGGLLMSRFFGGALLQVGVLIYLARAVTDADAQRAIVLGSLVGSIVGLAVALEAQTSHVVNALGWSTVAIYLLLALGYGYFQFAHRGASARLN
jgi:uncharacterized membrane protein YfcA